MIIRELEDVKREVLKLREELKRLKKEHRSARIEQLRQFLESKGCHDSYMILELKDPLGPAVFEDFDAIIVSEETKPNAEEINRKRVKDGLNPLEIITVKMAYAENGEVISSTKVLKGEMDRDGKILRTMKVLVGSENLVKIRFYFGADTEIVIRPGFTSLGKSTVIGHPD